MTTVTSGDEQVFVAYCDKHRKDIPKRRGLHTKGQQKMQAMSRAKGEDGDSGEYRE